MSNRTEHLLSATLLACLLVAASVCRANDGLRVLVTVKPIHSIVASLMLDIEGPELLIDGNQTPDSYQPGAGFEARLAQYDLVIWVGPELERALYAPLQQAPTSTRVLEVLANPNLKVLPARGGRDERDPYLWLDNRNMQILAEDLAGLFQSMDPGRAHVYARNLRRLSARLGEMDRRYEYSYRKMKAAPALQYHDTLQYFEQAYALYVHDRVSDSLGDPGDAQSLLRVRSWIQSGRANCLLLEKGMPAANLSLLTDGSGVEVVHLDSLGTELDAGPELYFELMESNTERIRACLAPGLAPANGQPLPQEVVGIPEEGHFLLTDTRGRLVSDADLHGGYHLLYFGYTFCPDICPTSLVVMSSALKMLGDKARHVEPWFVTVDPQRDTLEVLREYVAYFDKRLVGLTGPPAMIDRLAARLKVRYEKVVDDTRDPDLYLVDHSGSIYLVGPDGRYLTKFPHGVSTQQLYSGLLEHLPP